MLLVKCKCGCRFTLDEHRKRNNYVHCPNCEGMFQVSEETPLYQLDELLKGVESVSRIPENAKIEVSFDV